MHSSLCEHIWIENCRWHGETLVDGQLVELGRPVDIAVTFALVKVYGEDKAHFDSFA